MYNEDDTNPFEDRKTRRSPSAPVIDRFESWLRAHGYQPGRDPFFPAESYVEDAVDVGVLVAEYLQERPGEQQNRNALLRHAEEIGAATPVWAANGYGLPLIFRELVETVATTDRPCDPARDVHPFVG